ncbi:related to capsular associated protein (CAP10) [Rhynchosporium secalis]|uniref:Related to capsular associated protein (CAP10) n=1 Tax=Rhynchosporium secalis TaxID=38038 RepID=A0A1E1LUL1_RHYSE|nr:related to capsular associated protein (CAP10) [Rhynchosporium secalis]
MGIGMVVQPRLLRLVPIVVCVLSLFIVSSYLYTREVVRIPHIPKPDWWTAAPRIKLPTPDEDAHPIIVLLNRAEETFDTLLAKQTFNLSAAAQAYRTRRDRPPPPGFGRWWKYAQKNKVVMVEDFWDQIYHDLNPLWALDPKEMLQDVRGQERQMKIRKGNVTTEGDHFWMDIWREMVQTVGKNLPDMDIAMNTMDEPRMWVPWEKMSKYMEIEGSGRRYRTEGDLVDKYTDFLPLSENETVPEYNWNGSRPYWERLASPCPPDSEARTSPVQTDFSQPPNISLAYTKPHLYKGYVSNYTLSTSFCHQPDLQGLHGFFIESISMSSTDKLFPMFGSSKLSTNSEILIPPTMYYKGDERFTSKEPPTPWKKKTDTLVWRGLASGGRNKDDNWKGFHRHRLVSMLNGTQAILMPDNSSFIDVAKLPLEIYNLTAWSTPEPAGIIPRAHAMGAWLNSFTNASFNDLACFPRQEAVDERWLGGCSYTDYLFTPTPSINLAGQHRHKYLPDVDGNSFSGRYRDFLNSLSVPLKATLFKEWHDSRLVAWKHFVPIDNRFLDIYGVMEFFLGSPSQDPDVGIGKATEGETRGISEGGQSKKREGGRDHIAQKIGADGHEWSQKVLRVEDMRVYTYRVLLEYARVMDPKRDMLGWIEQTEDELEKMLDSEEGWFEWLVR